MTKNSELKIVVLQISLCRVIANVMVLPNAPDFLVRVNGKAEIEEKYVFNNKNLEGTLPYFFSPEAKISAVHCQNILGFAIDYSKQEISYYKSFLVDNKQQLINSNTKIKYAPGVVLGGNFKKELLASAKAINVKFNSDAQLERITYFLRDFDFNNNGYSLAALLPVLEKQISPKEYSSLNNLTSVKLKKICCGKKIESVGYSEKNQLRIVYLRLI